jgi:hypothetical protein
VSSHIVYAHLLSFQPEKKNMGIYETKVCYYGRLRSSEAYQRLESSGALRDEYIKRVGNGYWILHAPGRYARDMNDWQDPSEDQLETLKNLIRIASGRHDEEPATYMCEIQWSTLNLPTDDASPVRNIRLISEKHGP